MRLLAIALFFIQFMAGAAISDSKIQNEENNIKLLANAIAKECGEADTERSHYICIATFIKQVVNQLQSNAGSNIIPFDPPFPFDPDGPFNPPGPEPDYPIRMVLSDDPIVPFDPIIPREPGPDEVPNEFPGRDRDRDRE